MAAEGSDTWSLVTMFETWFRTVLRLIISSRAMVALPFPAEISTSTARSRSVSKGNAALAAVARIARGRGGWSGVGHSERRHLGGA
jgi:hypothetical protein